jgi:hypothetical protein
MQPPPRGSATDHPDAFLWARTSMVRPLTLRGTKGGGGAPPPPQPPSSGVCARSGVDCANSGYRSWTISTWCQQRYGNSYPIGCEI